MRKRSLLILGTAIMLSCGVVGCGSEIDNEPKSVETQTEGNKEDTKEDTKEEVKEEKKVFGVGETVDFDGVQFTVTDYHTSEGKDFNTPKEGNVFYIINLDIKNNSGEQYSYNPLNFEIKDGSGVITDNVMVMNPEGDDLSSCDIADGGNLSGTITFEASATTESLELLCKSHAFTDKADFSIKLK